MDAHYVLLIDFLPCTSYFIHFHAVLPWFYHGFAMVLPWFYRGFTLFYLASCMVLPPKTRGTRPPPFEASLRPSASSLLKDLSASTLARAVLEVLDELEPARRTQNPSVLAPKTSKNHEKTADGGQKLSKTGAKSRFSAGPRGCRCWKTSPATSRMATCAGPGAHPSWACQRQRVHT